MTETEELRVRRIVTAGVMAAAALIGTALVTLGSAAPESVPESASRPASELRSLTVAAPHATVTPASTVASTVAPTTTTSGPVPDPGALPQTDERPSASGPTFTTGVDALWQAIRQDRPELGLPFFFPEQAYLQVKAIGDPAGDYQHRLVANFAEDVHALHAQLGPDAANATFVGITVPDDQAVFVQPGEESNRLTYWRVYGSTLEYEVDGRRGSLPVTSLISWRGQWYVVHLGPIR